MKNRRYPEYTKLVRDFVGSVLKLVKDEANASFAHANEYLDNDEQRILFVMPKLGEKGGTPQTNADLMRGLRNIGKIKPFLLVSDGLNLMLYSAGEHKNDLLESHTLDCQILPGSHCSDEYDDTVIKWLIRYSICLVHYRHLALHSYSVLPYKASWN